MPPAKADFTKTNGFKAFSGFWQGNPLIQPQYSADSRLFRAKQTNPMPTSGSSSTSKQVFWLVEPMWNRGISPQINQYDQGRKVCRLKTRWLYATRPEDIARQSRSMFTDTFLLFSLNSPTIHSMFFEKFLLIEFDIFLDYCSNLMA